MKREDAVTALIKAVKGKVAPQKHIPYGNILFQDLPYVVEGKYAGVSFKDAMKPHFLLPEEETNVLIETYLWHLLKNDDMPAAKAAVQELVPSTYFRRIFAPVNVDTCTARLIWTLSQQEGYEGVVSKGTLLIKRNNLHLGIQDGRYVSKFFGGVKYDSDPHELLTKPGKMEESSDLAFISMYRQALRFDENLATAILVLKDVLGDRFQGLLVERRKHVLSDREKERIKDLLFNTLDDPYRHVYMALVPEYMTSKEFQTQLVRLPKRPMNPTRNARSKVFGRIVRHPAYGNFGNSQ